MRNEREDLLEIIFENRNKEYGAYALRKGYASTMTRSLVVGVGLVVSAAVLLSMRTGGTGHTHRSEIPGDTVSVVFPPPPPVDPPPPPPPPQVHTVVNNVPVVVIDDQVPPDKVVPPVDSLVVPAFGDHASAGTDPTGNAPVPPSAPAAPPTPPTPPDPPIFQSSQVDDPAEYPGGAAALGRFLQQRLQDPRDGSGDNDGQVKVRVIFVVNAEGEVGTFRALEGAEARFSDEVVRVLRKMPRWKPAHQRGRPVSMYFVLPVVFDQRTE